MTIAFYELTRTPLSQNILRLLETNLEQTILTEYPVVHAHSDGEPNIQLPTGTPSLRDVDVYFFQAHHDQIGARVTEQLLAINAAKKGRKARSVTLIQPYLLGQRAERRTQAGMSVNLSTYLHAYWAQGADRIITTAMHEPSSAGIFDAIGFGNDRLDYEHLDFNMLAAHIIKEHQPTHGAEIVLCAPDEGALKPIIKGIQEELDRQDVKHDIGVVSDRKDGHYVIGNVHGKVVYLIDDIGGTLTTLANAVQACKAADAGLIIPILAHPILATGYHARLETLLEDPQISRIYFGDTIPLKTRHAKIHTINTAPVFAETIRRIQNRASISALHEYATLLELYEKELLIQ